MASTKQIEANRSNALKSTGPRTAKGKARSSRNALTHGLTAQEILIPGEDVRVYRSFEQRLIDDFQPDGACELDLIERFAATCWRLRRIPRFEATLMALFERSVLKDDMSWGAIDAGVQEELDNRTAARWPGQDPYQLRVAGRVLRSVLAESGVLLKLNTYEARLLRQSQQLLGQLFALRKARAADLLLDQTAGDAALDPNREMAVEEKDLGKDRSRH